MSSYTIMLYAGVYVWVLNYVITWNVKMYKYVLHMIMAIFSPNSQKTEKVQKYLKYKYIKVKRLTMIIFQGQVTYKVK